ncbi:AraC family transcriptional regulator [Niallia oryzisoli]|uniref:AraC family transcriptional regulator n=1 Tax=Niallia oryzisoli TaxID=1737571 RepID=UPI0037357CC3
MPQKRVLHLLNGQALYNFYKTTHFLDGECMIPFNEAMCYGETCSNIFSHNFIQIRANVHHVTTEQYSEITLKPLQRLFRKNFSHLTLWFDEDMFCQINILTILAWLDQNDYKGAIDLHIIGEKFERKESFSLKVEGYAEMYNQVLVNKTLPKHIFPNPLKRGIELYLNYLDKDSDLMRFITKYQDVSEEELVTKLIVEFQHYGLGDVQYLEMIRSSREG